MNMRVPKTIYIVAAMSLAALVTACHAPAREDSIESLTKDPARLKDVLKQCKDAPESLPEQTCRAAAEAFRQRFFAPGGANAGNAAAGHDTPGTRP
jgi:conjugative transfer region protein TrbK